MNFKAYLAACLYRTSGLYSVYYSQNLLSMILMPGKMPEALSIFSRKYHRKSMVIDVLKNLWETGHWANNYPIIERPISTSKEALLRDIG